MDIQILEQFTQHLKLENKSLNTISTYTGAVRMFLRWYGQTFGDVPFTRLYRENILDYISYMNNIEQTSSATFNGRLSSLHSFNEFLLAAGKQSDLVVGKNDYRKVQNSIANPCVIEQKDVDEVRQKILIEHGPRDYAMVTIMAYAGTRVSELISIQCTDIDLTARTLRIRSGKGDKERIIFIGSKVVNAVRAYLNVRCSPSPYLFVSRTGKKLDRSRLNQILVFRCGHTSPAPSLLLLPCLGERVPHPRAGQPGRTPVRPDDVEIHQPHAAEDEGEGGSALRGVGRSQGAGKEMKKKKHHPEVKKRVRDYYREYQNKLLILSDKDKTFEKGSIKNLGRVCIGIFFLVVSAGVAKIVAAFSWPFIYLFFWRLLQFELLIGWLFMLMDAGYVGLCLLREYGVKHQTAVKKALSIYRPLFRIMILPICCTAAIFAKSMELIRLQELSTYFFDLFTVATIVTSAYMIFACWCAPMIPPELLHPYIYILTAVGLFLVNLANHWWLTYSARRDPPEKQNLLIHEYQLLSCLVFLVATFLLRAFEWQDELKTVVDALFYAATISGIVETIKDRASRIGEEKI